jgi:hypothetical protein
MIFGISVPGTVASFAFDNRPQASAQQHFADSRKLAETGGPNALADRKGDGDAQDNEQRNS